MGDIVAIRWNRVHFSLSLFTSLWRKHLWVSPESHFSVWCDSGDIDMLVPWRTTRSCGVSSLKESVWVLLVSPRTSIGEVEQIRSQLVPHFLRIWWTDHLKPNVLVKNHLNLGLSIVQQKRLFIFQEFFLLIIFIRQYCIHQPSTNIFIIRNLDMSKPSHPGISEFSHKRFSVGCPSNVLIVNHINSGHFQ